MAPGNENRPVRNIPVRTGRSDLEQGTGIEPASEAWEAPIIADILTLLVSPIIAEGIGNIKSFLSKAFWSCIKSEAIMGQCSEPAVQNLLPMVLCLVFTGKPFPKCRKYAIVGVENQKRRMTYGRI